ncbi:TraV family lipoprotein [Gemmobacter fulva]|uniref:TraV family lipoprotein n=1 Tax=Gemmobacter fulvus TaxID=2840474 RepID=UPI0021B118EB|nr:TraV family lipoprotein [Gemmobacter fulvus]
MNKAISACLAMLLVSGCGQSNTEKDFLCPAQTGMPCSTIADADGSGDFSTGQSIRERGEDTLASDLTQPPLMIGKGKLGAASTMGDGGHAYMAASYRLPEKVGTAWIAPHSEGGALYEASYVHFLILPAEWGNRP